MRARKLFVAVAVWCLLGACGTPEPGTGAAQPSSVAAASSTPPTPAGEPAPVAASSATVAATASQAPVMERSAIENLVKADLAGHLGVSSGDIQVAGTEERTWLKGRLGCGERDLAGEPLPTPGYLITLQHGTRLYPYHTDRAGNFVRCLEPGKPIGPITR